MTDPERFISPCALPSDREREILTILIEEAAEVQQRATKLLRFGRDEVQPGQDQSNRDRLSAEIGDLICMFHEAEELGLVRKEVVDHARRLKRLKLAKFLQS